MRYTVELHDDERKYLRGLISAGSPKARTVKRAQILLAADAGVSAQNIVTSVGTSTSTIFRTKRKFVEEGLEAALREKGGRGSSRKLDAKQEATLVALACSAPPEGRRRWTQSLLAERLVMLTELDDI